MASSAPTVFISYAREDLDSAKRLNNDLKSSGVSTWFDKERILPGEKWKTAIKKAIENSRYFLAILSSNSVGKKGYVQKELANALDLLDEFPHSEIFVIPVRLDDCKPSHEKLDEIHWADMFPDWEDGLAKILSTLQHQTEELIAQNNVHDRNLSEMTLDLSEKITSSVIVSEHKKESSEFEKQKDTKDLYLVDIMDLLPTTELTLVSLSSYFKLTKQDIKWADIANEVISQFIGYCTTPMLTLDISVNKVYYDTPRLYNNLKLFDINRLIELDDIMKDATIWGKEVIKKVFLEIFEEILHTYSIGTTQLFYDSYDIIAIIVLYSKRYMVIENPKLLDDTSIPISKKILKSLCSIYLQL